MSSLTCDSFCLLHLKRQSHTSFHMLIICRVYLSFPPTPPQGSSGHFHDFLLIFSFWQFDNDISKCVSLFVYPAWDLLIFLDMHNDVCLQNWGFFSPMSSNIYIFVLPHSLPSPSGTPVMCMIDYFVPEVARLCSFFKDIFSFYSSEWTFYLRYCFRYCFSLLEFPCRSCL